MAILLADLSGGHIIPLQQKGDSHHPPFVCSKIFWQKDSRPLTGVSGAAGVRPGVYAGWCSRRSGYLSGPFTGLLCILPAGAP
jgi:hypothetical protein